MLSRSLALLVAALLLIGLATASGTHSRDSPTPTATASPSPSPERRTPKQQRARRRCRILLRKARRELKCALRRISLPRRISRARKCRYNGLRFKEYRKIRTICKMRSESLTRLRAARKKCRMAGISVRSGAGYPKDDDDDDDEEEDKKPVDVSGITCDMYDDLKAARKKAVKACEMIGWTGGRARERRCEKLKSLKYMLRDLEKSKCGEDGVEEAEKELKRIKRRCRGTGGIVEPPPSNAPRAR